jgi:hypothetical protein
MERGGVHILMDHFGGAPGRGYGPEVATGLVKDQGAIVRPEREIPGVFRMGELGGVARTHGLREQLIDAVNVGRVNNTLAVGGPFGKSFGGFFAGEGREFVGGKIGRRRPARYEPANSRSGIFELRQRPGSSS